jgi:DNA-binding CsgD family transcriptional regulator
VTVAAVETDRRWEYCPDAHADALMVNGVCRFCRGNHKLAARLTKQQRQAVRLLANGNTLKQTAAQLGANYNTLSGDLREARLMVNARTTEQLVALLAREGSA